MSSSFEKSVKGATKIKAAPPKAKYIEHILVATHSGEAGVGEVFRALQNRLRDSTWTVVFKSLITVHLMIRDGSPDVTLAFLARNRNMLAIGSFTDAQTQGRNIRHYASYLAERARAFRDTRTDWVRAPESRLERLSVEKGLLRETESVQRQLSALLKCDVLETEPENEVTITVFRLLVLDLLALFQVLNLGLINILGHFFEMSKTDAERAMDVYRTFTRQTDYVVAYLGVARQFEHHTRVEVPKLKHAPVNLGRQLEDYLKDADFEIHRRQYMAEQDAKKKKPFGSKQTKPDLSFPKPAANNPFPTAANGSSSSKPAATESKPQANKGPDPDLIDFFDSIEQNQTSMQVNQQPTAAQPPPNNAFQTQSTGMQFQNTGFVPQQPAGMPQNSFQQQPTGFQPNILQQQPTGFQQNSLQQQATGFQQNNFQQQNTGAFMPQQQPQLQPPQQQQQQQQAPQPLQPNFTGAGFGGYTPQPSFQPGSLQPIQQNTASNFEPQGSTSPPTQMGQQPGSLQPMQTGTTNPFRQSMLLSQQQTGSPNMSSPPNGTPNLHRQSTNPFARSSPQNGSPFASTPNSPFQSQPPQQPPAPAPLQPTPTGTNPFARNTATSSPSLDQQQRPQTAGAIAPQPTGNTNPFRHGAFVNHNTGLGWQHNQAPIGGGLDQVQTMPVFPRPAQQTPWQQ